MLKEKDGTWLTLQELCNKINVHPETISLDLLNAWADDCCFHRFDHFNSKYNPFGEPLLRTVFLKTDNDMKGKYLAEITQELLTDLIECKYQFAEYRLSIYGRSMSEWDTLAGWVMDNNLVGLISNFEKNLQSKILKITPF